MTEPVGEVLEKRRAPEIPRVYGSLPSMLRKFDRLARQDVFSGTSPEEFREWSARMRALLRDLLGLDRMEPCGLTPVTEDVRMLPGGIRREHVRIQTEPDVWMPMYLLIPASAGAGTKVFLCPPGHNGGGKYSVAGCGEYEAVAEKIGRYHYDYGLQLAKLGYIAVCPDCRGFGERREEQTDTQDPALALKGDCYWLAHMGEPLGIPVMGMLVWDLMRALDYVRERGDWDEKYVGCLGFSGGGMQTLFFAALDERVSAAVISGYFYGYREALLRLNRNCSCNYIPHLWEHLDMGDIASLIAPRPLWIQSCRDDRLNGPAGLSNVFSQVETTASAYRLLGVSERLIHEICEGTHQWHGEHLEENLKKMVTGENHE